MRHNYQTRRGRPEDSRTISVLSGQVWLHTYAIDGVDDLVADYVLAELSPQKYQQRLHDPETAVFVAEHDLGLLGFAVTKLNATCPSEQHSSVELQTLYVQAHHLRSGIGSTLLKLAEGFAREQSGHGLWLMVNAKNERAKTFYAHHGYVRVGTTYFVLGEGRHENDVLIAAGDA